MMCNKKQEEALYGPDKFSIPGDKLPLAVLDFRSLPFSCLGQIEGI